MQKRRSRRLSALFVASVANLKPAQALTLDDDLAVLRAQFNLANVTASGIDLLSNQRRAFETTSRFALRNVLAAVDANFCRRGVEVRLKHLARAPGGSSLEKALTTVRSFYCRFTVGSNPA